MSDLFGHEAQRQPFKDIRNQRASAAEEKAQLCLHLNRLLQTPPRGLASASIQRVRQWRAEDKRCLSVPKSPASSRGELKSAITTMQGFE